MAKDEIWIQKDGTKIAVSEMSESHAKNALRMLIRKHNASYANMDDAFTGIMQDFYKWDNYGSGE